MVLGTTWNMQYFSLTSTCMLNLPYWADLYLKYCILKQMKSDRKSLQIPHVNFIIAISSISE